MSKSGGGVSVRVLGACAAETWVNKLVCLESGRRNLQLASSVRKRFWRHNGWMADVKVRADIVKYALT